MIAFIAIILDSIGQILEFKVLTLIRDFLYFFFDRRKVFFLVCLAFLSGKLGLFELQSLVSGDLFLGKESLLGDGFFELKALDFEVFLEFFLGFLDLRRKSHQKSIYEPDQK